MDSWRIEVTYHEGRLPYRATLYVYGEEIMRKQARSYERAVEIVVMDVKAELQEVAKKALERGFGHKGA